MKEIVDVIKNRRCVVFAGAGISQDAGLPSWLDFGKQLCERLIKAGKIPSDYHAAITSLVVKKETIPAAIDMLLAGGRRTDVVAEIREILRPPSMEVTKGYAALKKLEFRGFVTTNYDRLLEAIISTHSHRLSNSFADLKIVPIAVGNKSDQFLLKLHGDIDNILSPDDIEVTKGAPFMVLAKSDYTVLIQGERGDALRHALHAVIQESSLLFLGYSFSDPDIRLALEFLSKYCKFSNPSWFVGLNGEILPSLPSGITGIQPFKDWSELPAWLDEIHKEVCASGIVVEQQSIQKLSGEDKHALQALGEFLHGLESDNLCEKTLGSILLNELKVREEINYDWITEFISNFLVIGPTWAEAFTKAVIRQLLELKVLKESDNEKTFKVVKTRLVTMQEKANSEWQNDWTQFFDSVKSKMVYSGVNLTDIFINKLDAALQHLCMHFGQHMAEWVHSRTSKEIGQRHISEIVPTYFDDPQDVRKVEELFNLIFDNPAEKEIGYIYRLLSAAFLLNSIKLDPSASKLLKDSISQYELYLDANVLLPLLIQEHPNHRWIASIIKTSKEAGANLFVIKDIFEEVSGHRGVANKISKDCNGDVKSLSLHAELFGYRTNCFVQGYLNKKRAAITWNEYISKYTDQKLERLLQDFDINLVVVNVTDVGLYKNVLSTIKSEWNIKGGIQGRHDKLDEDEAKQFLHIHQRRMELLSSNKKDDVWFLSYETVFEKVYMRNPQLWRKPATFPVSAWASFLDARMTSEHKNRKDILNAILKGNSTAYNLPDTIALVKRKAFEHRVLSDAEYEALNLSMTGWNIVDRLERAKSALLKRANSDTAQEFKLARQDIVSDIDSELNKKIEYLNKQLAVSKENVSEEVARLKLELENLKAQIKRRERHKKKQKRKK